MSTSINIRIAAALIAVTLVSVFAVRATSAAFSDQTSNDANQFNAGTVILTDDDAGSALFDGSALLAPGDSQVGCIEVTYSGSLNAEVHIFGTDAGGTGLEAFLNLDVERGTGTCAAFVADQTVWDNTADGDLGTFLTTATNYATGADTWQPVGGAPDDTVPYRITVTLQDNNGAQGLTSTVNFIWEAQNI